MKIGRMLFSFIACAAICIAASPDKGSALYDAWKNKPNDDERHRYLAGLSVDDVLTLASTASQSASRYGVSYVFLVFGLARWETNSPTAETMLAYLRDEKIHPSVRTSLGFCSVSLCTNLTLRNKVLVADACAAVLKQHGNDYDTVEEMPTCLLMLAGIITPNLFPGPTNAYCLAVTNALASAIQALADIVTRTPTNLTAGAAAYSLCSLLDQMQNTRFADALGSVQTQAVAALKQTVMSYKEHPELSAKIAGNRHGSQIGLMLTFDEYNAFAADPDLVGEKAREFVGMLLLLRR